MTLQTQSVIPPRCLFSSHWFRLKNRWQCIFKVDLCCVVTWIKLCMWTDMISTLPLYLQGAYNSYQRARTRPTVCQEQTWRCSWHTPTLRRLLWVTSAVQMICALTSVCQEIYFPLSYPLVSEFPEMLNSAETFNSWGSGLKLERVLFLRKGVFSWAAGTTALRSRCYSRLSSLSLATRGCERLRCNLYFRCFFFFWQVRLLSAGDLKLQVLVCIPPQVLFVV